MKTIKLFGLPSKEELNPKLWESDRLKSNVRQAFLIIAERFHETLDIDSPPADIRILGSNASYS